MMNFKEDDFAVYKAFDEFGLPCGPKWGQIIGFKDEYAVMVFGGIDVNRLNHFKPNYMKAVRVRDININDDVKLIRIKRLRHIDCNTIFGNF